MAKNPHTDGSLALKGRTQRVIIIQAAEKPKNIKLRVAAYARVSSSSEDQLNSFAAQNRYYTDLIACNPTWEQVDIYADEGISGTAMEKRADFLRMIADCRKGLIDRILVKSISRFARNTMECLKVIRELKLLGIGVHFEKENIDTATMSGEMMTAMFASLAQAESESISGNMRWSVHKRMANGTYLPSSMPYGYKLVNKKIEIVPDEAAIVCRIFRYYLSGMGKSQIANILNEEEILTNQGCRWNYNTIHYILGNERYIGDSLWQKTYASDSFPPCKMKNHGERKQYYAVETHPQIVSKEMFEAVQNLAAQREEKFGRDNGSGFPLSRKVICKECGRIFRRKEIRGKIYWTCLTHERKASACSAMPVAEEHIYEAFLRLYFNLKHQGNFILREMLDGLISIRNRQMLWSEDVVAINQQISDICSQNQMLAQLKQQGLIDPDIFIAQRNELATQLRETKSKKQRLLEQTGDAVLGQTQELLDILESGPDELETFDREIFDEVVNQIVVESNNSLQFRLTNGLELTERLERNVH